MGECDSCGEGAGPFSEGRELVEFVYFAHGGGLRNQPIPTGGLRTNCQECGAGFTLITFVGNCPECGGAHAVSPPLCGDASNIQFAGVGYKLPD